jgi:hypothetical protein
MLKFEQLCLDFGIETTTEGQHSRKGWLQINCPFCDAGENSKHMGFNLLYGSFACWKCGKHSPFETIAQLTKSSTKETLALVKKYQGDKNYIPIERGEKKYNWDKKFALPQTSGELQRMHIQYLLKRDFDPEKIKKEWKIQGTGVYGKYAFRIIMPVYINRKLVNFTGRDVSDRAKLRYDNCPNEESIMPLKETVYGYDYVRDTVVVVEGPTDVWRLGRGAVATFGSAYTIKQVKLLKNFKTRYIMFDPTDDRAQKRAKELAHDLGCFTGRTEILKFSGYKDPGALPQKEADDLMHELGFKR